MAATQVLCQVPNEFLTWGHLLEMLFLPFSAGQKLGTNPGVIALFSPSCQVVCLLFFVVF